MQEKERLEKLTAAKYTYKMSPANSKEEAQAFIDWLSLCNTVAEASKAFHITSDPGRIDMAFKRWLELCTTTDESHEAYLAATSPDHKDLAVDRTKELSAM